MLVFINFVVAVFMNVILMLPNDQKLSREYRMLLDGKFYKI